MVDIFDSAHSYSHSVLNKMTRRKDSPQKNESETVLYRVTELDYNSMSENQLRSTIINLLVALEKKSIKESKTS